MHCRLIFAGFVAFLTLVSTPAPAQETFVEGDKVEAQDCTHGCIWRAGTVRKEYGLLVVVFESNVLPDGTKLDEIWSSVRINSSTRVRRAGTVAQAVPVAGAAPAASAAPATTPFKVGDRVDDKGTRPSHARGTIIDAKPPSYRVRYDGCGDTFNSWRDVSELAPAAVIPAGHAEVKFLAGMWDMFVAGAPTTVRKGNDLYRQYSTGAKAPPLEIRANGTYAWTENFNQPPVQGQWTPSARIADAQIGSERFDGIIIKDRAGNPWKLYRRNTDQMEMRVLCSNATQMGTRIR